MLIADSLNQESGQYGGNELLWPRSSALSECSYILNYSVRTKVNIRLNNYNKQWCTQWVTACLTYTV